MEEPVKRLPHLFYFLTHFREKRNQGGARLYIPLRPWEPIIQLSQLSHQKVEVIHVGRYKKLSYPMDNLPNSSRGTDCAVEWDTHGDLPGKSSAIITPRWPLALATKALYLEVEGPGWEEAEETRGFMKKNHNDPMGLLSQ